jgi:hypothetical protein
MSKGKHKKQVKTSAPISETTQKIPKTVVQPNFNQLKPAWRVSLLEMRDPFGWHEVSREKLAEIREKLSNFESMTWNEILIVAKKFHHTVQVIELDRRAQDRLKEINQDDIDEIVSLRLSNKERVWGIRENEVLKILWWDPNHEICPSLLRNT